jgi:two-component system, sensor histidine kinase PdtaS
MKPLKVALVFWMLFVVSCPGAVAQRVRDSTLLEKEFERSLQLLNSFRVDSAKTVLNQLAAELSKHNNLDTEFGMNVRLKQAEAWENDHNDQKAIKQLLDLVTLSEAKGYWGIYAEANISLARLYEKLELPDKCITRLRMAQKAINKHKLNSIHPRFFIRLASYYRVFKGQLDSAKLYAMQAVKTVPKDKLSIHEGTAYLLLALIEFHSSPEIALRYYHKAGKVFKELSDDTGYSFVLLGQSQIHMSQGRLKQALLYNDSTMMAAGRARELGNEQYYVEVEPLRVRAAIFRAMNNLDSSWYYINKAYDIEVDAIRTANNEKIIEVEARYNDELKSQKLVQQEKRLILETQRKNLIILGLVVTLVFSAFVLYLYTQLRASYRITKQQATEIAQANDNLKISLKQQSVLQREVHHRVTNNLQTLISLLEIQAEKLTDKKAAQSLETLCNRIWSMAIVHEMLYRDHNLDAIEVQSYVEKLCGYLSDISGRGNRIIYTIEMKGYHFNLQTLTPIGLIINELCTNSIKHAVAPSETLRLFIGLETKKDGYLLTFTDNGSGFSQEVTDDTGEGLGIYLIKSMVRQLDGDLKVKNSGGAEYNIFFKEEKIGV